MAESAAKKKTWKDTFISFTYGGKAHKAKIKGQLVLNDMSLQEIKDRLNDLPGRFAYWKSLQVTVEREKEKCEEEYDIWYAGMYDAAVESFKTKPTESAIRNKVLMGNTTKYRKIKEEIRELAHVAAQIGVITAAYNHQAWTLRSIAALTGQEMSNIEIHGKGDLSNL